MSENQPSPTALPAGSAPLTVLDEALFVRSKTASRASPRRRIIQPLHKQPGDLLQRMINTLQPGSYIRPHRHASDRAESLVVLAGSLIYFAFNDCGELSASFRLAAGGSACGIDTDGGVWHSFAALEPDTVLFEVKPGPYDPATDKQFAAWAPDEQSADAAPYLNALLTRTGL